MHTTTSPSPRPGAVKALIAAIAVMVVGIGLASQPGASASSAGWDGGFEDGTTTAWKNEQESSPERITLVTDVDGTGRALDGRWAARIRCGRQDQGVAGSGSAWRTELTSSGTTTAATPGTQSWWSWQLYLGSDFAAPPIQGGWAILTQFHGGTGSPVVAFEVDHRDALLLRTRGGNPTNPTKNVTTMVPDLARQRPYQVVMHADWSPTADGRVRVWIDGTLVADQHGPNLYDGHDAYLKMGCYRSDSTVHDGTVWIDGIRRTIDQPTTRAVPSAPPSTTGQPAASTETSGTTSLDAFVHALHVDFLGRAPTAGERAAHVTALRSGAPAGALVEQFSSSDAWLAALVDGYYRSALGRAADPAGRAHWIGQIRRGRTPASVAAEFYGSEEYYRRSGGHPAAWIDALYAVFLDRPADAAGSVHWDAVLRRGVARPTVADSFHQSVESRRQRVEALYERLLGRAADAHGLTHWTRVLADGHDVRLAANLAQSAEYRAMAVRRFATR